MFSEVAGLNERLGTDWTTELSMLEVESHVLTQLTGIEELLTALRTGVGWTTGVVLWLNIQTGKIVFLAATITG